MPPVQDLVFKNQTPNDDDGPFEKLLDSGLVNLEVNSIDVAGVEVANFLRPFTFVVNFDPETLMLDRGDRLGPSRGPRELSLLYPPERPDTDPPSRSRVGDRIPDRTYVVTKALARDNPKDNKLDTDFKIGVSGFLQGTRR